MQTKRQIAEKIIDTLKQHSSPGQCSWGDEYEEAHGELFGFYYEDLVQDVEKILNDIEKFT